MIVQGKLNELLNEAVKGSYDMGVCAKITDSDGRVLLLRRAPSDTSPAAWEMPGGSVEPGEGLIDAVAREVKEETGLDIDSEPRYVSCFDFKNVEKGVIKRKFCFEVIGAGEAAIGPDHDAYNFFSVEEIRKMPTDKAKGGEYIFRDHYESILL